MPLAILGAFGAGQVGGFDRVDKSRCKGPTPKIRLPFPSFPFLICTLGLR